MEDTCIALLQALGTSQASLFMEFQPHGSLVIGSDILKEKKKNKLEPFKFDHQ
jgi:3-hydroxy-3-methylglutaryl CoA synthase